MAEQTWTISSIPAGSLVGNPRSIFEVGADEISNERVIADLAGANYAIYPTNLQYFTGGFGTTLSLDLSSTPAGNSQVSDELSATFERQGVVTITIGGHELTITIGTDTNRDTGEPYSWTLTSAARTRGNAWLAQLSVGDTGTFTLSDGVTSTDHVIATAGTPEWDFATTEPTVTVRTARHIIASAGTPEWDFETTEPTVTHRTTQHVIATAGTPEWDFETTEPSVTHRTTRHTITTAGVPEWDFETTEPSVTLTAAAPVSDRQYAFRRAATLDETTGLPSSRAAALPTGWSDTEPARTATEGIWRIASDRTTLRGAFVSRTPWAWSPAYGSQPYRLSLDELSRYIRKFVTNVRHKDSGAQASVVVSIQADPPEGIGYREITIYQTGTLSANAPSAPAAPEWDGTTLSAIGSWSTTFPTYDPNTHRVACVIVLVSTDNTAEVIGSVTFCESPGDLNAVFVRSTATPARLVDSATRLPANTYDTQGNVPDGEGHIYVAVGNRPPNGTTWTWSAWDQLEGTAGEDGADGEEGTGVEYIRASFANDNDVSAAQMPDNSWPYDTPGTVGGLTWVDGTPSDLGETRPYVRRAKRRVLGAPTKGDTRVALTADTVTAGQFRAGPWVVEDAVKVQGADGNDGKPGAFGIAQRFAVNISTASPDNNSEMRLRDGSTNLMSLTDTNAADVDTIEVGISTGVEAATVRRRRGYGALAAGDIVTVRERSTNAKFADYEITAVAPATFADTTRTVTLTVAYIEHVLDTAIDGDAIFGIAPARDGLDGIPGTRGLAGYAESFSRSTRAANAAGVNSATEWFLSGSTANWTSNRTFTVGVSAAEEAQIKRVGTGALMTVYDDASNWADYTLRSAPTFTGTGATRAAALSLAYVEGFGAPPTSGAVELHYTPAGEAGADGEDGTDGRDGTDGTNGLDGDPGIRGLAGYAESLTRSTRESSSGGVNAQSEWFLTGGTTDWTGTRTLTVGVSAADEEALERVAVGGLATVYDDTSNWADYTFRSAVSFAGTGTARRATISLAYVESVGVPPSTGAIEFHYTLSGKAGVDGKPSFPGFGATLAMALRAPNKAGIDTRQEWWAGVTSTTAPTTMDGLRNVTRFALSHIQTRSGLAVTDRRVFLNDLDANLDRFTLFWARDRWAEFVITGEASETSNYVEFNTVFLEGEWPDNNLPNAATQMTIVFSRSNYPLRVIPVRMYRADEDSANPGSNAMLNVANGTITGAASGWTTDRSSITGTVYAIDAAVYTRIETGTAPIALSQWGTRYEEAAGGGTVDVDTLRNQLISTDPFTVT